MSYYPTTLLPSYLPYKNVDNIIDIMCENCLKQQYDPNLSESTKQQYFELSMQIMDFWFKELSLERLK